MNQSSAGSSHIRWAPDNHNRRDDGEERQPETRKRCHSDSEDPYRSPPQPQLPLYRILPDGTREPNYQGYLQRGFGWVSSQHSTRKEWKEFVEEGHDYSNTKSVIEEITKHYPDWNQPGFTLQRRSRSRTRSPETPFKRPEKRIESPESDSDSVRYRSRSQTPVTEANTPMDSPGYNNDSI